LLLASLRSPKVENELPPACYPGASFSFNDEAFGLCPAAKFMPGIALAYFAESSFESM
jgi:hypothetical protein